MTYLLDLFSILIFLVGLSILLAFLTTTRVFSVITNTVVTKNKYNAAKMLKTC